MRARLIATLIASKTARRISRLRGHGGSALPGLVAERLMPEFLPTMLGPLPGGVIIVTGTNGKTSTTKMIADVLAANGRRVLTNKTGSNFTRGVAAAIVEACRLPRTRLPFDVAVLELDEAYSKHFVRKVRPSYVVALNVLRDQLDRFGEIDTTAQLIGEALQAATKGAIINGDDPSLAAIGRKLTQPVHYFGVAPALRKLFPVDEELLELGTKPLAHKQPALAVELHAFDGQHVTFRTGIRQHSAEFRIKGQYNFQNAAAALAVLQQALPDQTADVLVKQLAEVEPPFGRGETITIGGQPLEIVLVKNPAGFRQALRSFASPAHTMIAINDNYADGRDVSWLWDVDFSPLAPHGVALAAGMRAYDMAERLRYDNVAVGSTNPRLLPALKHFLRAAPDTPHRIFCTYTAMLSIRAYLATITDMKEGV